MNKSHGDTSNTVNAKSVLIETKSPTIAARSYANPNVKENSIEQADPYFRNYIVVLNEKSGSADLPGLRSFMEERAKELGKNVVFIELNRELDLGKELGDAADRQDTEVYVAAGGDGTLAAVAHHARQHKKIFAGIPCGTANVFAKEHGIPANAKDAAELALNGSRVLPVDILDVGGRTYLCHVSIGTYSWITLHTNAEAKRKYGRIAYMFNAIKLMMRDRIFKFDIIVDGKAYRRKASTIMVTNAGSMGATTMRWGEDIVTNDGIAEICIFKARTLKHYLALLWTFIRRKPHHPLKEYMRVHKDASVHGSKSLPVRADGEEIANGGFDFTIVKHGLRVILPESFQDNASAPPAG